MWKSKWPRNTGHLPLHSNVKNTYGTQSNLNLIYKEEKDEDSISLQLITSKY
jgi:hypothetical protein